MVAYEHESRICRDPLHALGVVMYAAEEDEEPCRAVKEPAVVGAVLIVDLFGVDQARTREEQQTILQESGYDKQ